jgi:hypothetical protein
VLGYDLLLGSGLKGVIFTMIGIFQDHDDATHFYQGGQNYMVALPVFLVISCYVQGNARKLQL